MKSPTSLILERKLSDYEFLESDLLQKLEGINQKVEEKKRAP